MKKTLLLLLLVLSATVGLRAQEYKTKLSGSNAKVIIEMRDGDVSVEGHDGNEIIIRGNGYEEPDKRAEGLRPVYNTAVDNTKLGLAVTHEGSTVRIVKASRRTANYTILVPRAADVVYRSLTWGGNDVLMQNLRGRLEVTMKSGDVKLLSVTGPVVASSTSGDITVRYATLNTGPSAISNISGVIDVALPPPTKATLTMRTVSGEVYTDFDLTQPKTAEADGMTRVMGGQATSGHINGGGTSISLKNISGNVYVRKAK